MGILGDFKHKTWDVVQGHACGEGHPVVEHVEGVSQ